LVLPFATVMTSLVTAAAWAVGESESYTTWSHHTVRPISAVMRGRFLHREVAASVGLGYLGAFAALGATTLVGMVASPSARPSIAAIRALESWPVFLYPATIGLIGALSTMLPGGMFLMTYAK